MCGITGIFCFNNIAEIYKSKLETSVQSLKYRGPDSNGIFINKNIGLGHARLAIVDKSNAGFQPFVDISKNYVLVFNGEFYNHNEYRKELLNDGVEFKSASDTEVLLYLLIKYGDKAIEKINGCFAFAFYDLQKKKCIIARDRFGKNPLLYYLDKDKIIFASEMKALLDFGIDKELDHEVVKTFFQLNYIPTRQSILKNVHKLEPGTFLTITESGVGKFSYYKIQHNNHISLSKDNYNTACKKLYDLLDKSVERMLIADVPVGSFLSGGIDSTIITALAAQYKKIDTFSLGFSGNDFFDETSYSEIVAKKYNTNHHTFKISNNDLTDSLSSVLDYIDEPFADSSALAVNILCKLACKKVSVALSGDGADEIFAGYNKHSAHFNVINAGIKGKVAANMNFLWALLPKSRNSKFANEIRKLNKFALGYKLSPLERYWYWASIGSKNYTNNLLSLNVNEHRFEQLKHECFDKGVDLTRMNDILYEDMHLVLQGDMLTKVDLMSMYNSLEVRTPFLDHTVVDYAFSLPENFKIDKNFRKKILRDTFKEYIPEEILSQPKHGFEVPLLNLLKNELRYLVDGEMLSEAYIKEQKVFNYEIIRNLKNKLNGQSPEDAASKIWALIIFQNWWNKYFYN